MILIRSPNFWKGRKGYKVQAIVIHIMDGTLQGTDAWFSNPRSMVSAHYGVAKTGNVHQYVLEEDTAWHAGKVKNPKWKLLKQGINPNLYTIGIEFEGRDNEKLTTAQLVIGAWLIFKICAGWSITIDTDHIIPHNWVYAGKICPGSGISIGRLVRLAQILKEFLAHNN